MAMTREQLRLAVIANTNRSDKASVINDAINLALDEATMRHRFKQRQVEAQVSVVEGDTSFPLPDAMNKLVSIRAQGTISSTFYNIAVKSKKWIEDRFPDLGADTTSGVPSYAYEENGVVHFVPTSSGQYTLVVTGSQLAGSMTSDTDQTSIPGIDQFVVAWVTAWVFASIEQFQNAQVWESKAEKALTIAIRSDKERPAVSHQSSPFGEPRSVTSIDPFNDPWAGRE